MAFFKQAATYKLDFDEERKDRAEAHSRYADLEKKMAELHKQHVQEISQITKDLELHKGSLGNVEGVKFALDKELRDWQAEALQSREELQSKTCQVKAYKKQLDQLKEKSKQEEQQVIRVFKLALANASRHVLLRLEKVTSLLCTMLRNKCTTKKLNPLQKEEVYGD